MRAFIIMIMRALIIRKFEKARELRKSVIHREGGRDRFADIELRPGSELKTMNLGFGIHCN